MPVNPGYEYVAAEKAYLNATTLEERITCLEEMIKTAPKHKSSENLLAGLKTRLKKFKEKKEKAKSTGKSTLKAIRKEGFQIVLLGFTGSGKSSLLSKLTNARPKVSSHSFTTKSPEIGTLDYQGVKAQIIDLPSIGSEFFDLGIIHTADLILIVITEVNELEKVLPHALKSTGKKLIAINKIDLLTEQELRKLNDKIKSKKLKAVPVSALTGDNVEKLKEDLLKEMEIIRIYMKEPGKPHSSIPMVLQKGSTVKDAAESILKGFSQKVKETRLTGPSSKFSNQKVGLSHVLKDRDIVEFHTK